jgi:acyl transferase domain-containing protein
MQALLQDGAMAAIFSDQATVQAAIEECSRADVAIAALNAPQSTVISGARESVADLIARFERRGTRCQRLAVSHAFHSPLMQPAADELAARAGAIPGQPPHTTWISTVSAMPMRQAPDANYWRDQALRPVRFADAMRALAANGVSDLLEIGPGNTLLVLGQQSVEENGMTWLASLSEGGELNEILTSLGELYRRGYDVDWQAFNRPRPRRRVSLPTYPFERRRFWLEREAQGFDRHARALGVARCSVREHLQLAAFPLSR